MNIFELDQSLRKQKSIEEGHGRYWCSTDKKWKERQGPKQTRKTESKDSGASKEQETEFHTKLDKLVHKTFGKRKDEDLETNEEKQRLDPKCWTGYRKAGTKMKGGVRVNNCVKVEDQDVAEGTLNELQHDSGMGNDPMAYHAILISLSKTIRQEKAHFASEEEADEIKAVARAFFKQGMEGGRRAFMQADTKDLMSDYLEDNGFDVQADLVEPYRDELAQMQAAAAVSHAQWKSSPRYAAWKADELKISAIPDKPINSWSKPGEPAVSVTMDRASKRNIKAEFEEFKKDLEWRHTLKGVPLRFEITVGGKPIDIDALKEQGASSTLQGTPVVSLKDLDDKDNKKNKYGQTVPKKLKKDDPRVKFYKDPKKGVSEESSNYIWIQGNFDGDTVATGSTQGSWRDRESTQVELVRGRMSNIRPLSGPPTSSGNIIKQARIPLTLDAGHQKFNTNGVDLQLTVAPNGYITQGKVGRVVGTAVVKIMKPGSVEEGLNEFSSGGRDPWSNDDRGEDPYSRPKPRHYNRSSSYFEQFEADHFDKEEFNKKTGVFKGYWENNDGSLTQIGYFKFDDPSRTGGDDPGMGWYYEPQNESAGVAEGNKEADYGPEYQDMVRRVGKLAKQGPLKTIWDPVKRVYKNVPVKGKQVKETGNSISLTMTDGSTRFVRSGSSAVGAVKSILNYLVRSKDFETLKNLKSIDGHDVTGIISKIFKPSNTIDLGEALDTEFQNFLKQAKHRYPDSKDETEAFMRFVHAELEKEGRIDRNQSQDIDYLEAKIDILIQDLSKISKTPPGL